MAGNRELDPIPAANDAEEPTDSALAIAEALVQVFANADPQSGNTLRDTQTEQVTKDSPTSQNQTE